VGDVLNEKPTVRLVATAGADDGRGHVGRALALAEALHEAGARIELELVRGALAPPEAARAAATGLELVVASTAAKSGSPVVVDLPVLEPTAGRFDPRVLAVFDDRDVFGGHAAIVIQPGLPAWAGPGVVDLVLAGYAYIPVSSAHRRLRETASSRTGADEPAVPLRVVACFGGSDPSDVTARLVPALASDHGWIAEVVVGSSYAGSTDGWALASTRDPVDLPERMARADIALIGAGTMKFEVACLGRPSLMVAVADDQLIVGPAFAATGAAGYLGDGRLIHPDVVRAAVASLASDPPRRVSMGRVAREIVDGRGATRIASAVLDLAR